MRVARTLVVRQTLLKKKNQHHPKEGRRRQHHSNKFNQHLTNERGGERSTTQKEARFSFSIFAVFHFFHLLLHVSIFFRRDVCVSFFFGSATFFIFHFFKSVFDKNLSRINV